MDRALEHSGIKRNKKACTECRQQKVRCDAKVDSSDPCTRCRKMQLKCVISDPFKREHKRQRLSELEQETNELRQKLQARHSWNGFVATPAASIESNISTMNGVLHARRTSSIISPSGDPPSIGTTAIGTEEPEEHPVSSPTLPTQPQILEGVHVPAALVDELFRRFFDDFSHFLPVLEQHLSPNAYYQQSEFLFWAIIGVACRNFPKNPTLLDSLGEKILTLALMSLRQPSVPNIKGLLLIMTWPLPRSASSTDITYAISGSLLHLAMQIGLHIPTSSQDFSRVKVCLTEAEIAKRAELWGYCIVTYQRACSLKGHSPLAMMETYQDSEQRHALFSRISPALRFQLRLNGLVTRCCSALLQNGLRTMTREQEHSLDVFIRVFEASLKDVEPEATSELDKLYLYVSRLTVQVFHLYKDQPKTFPTFLLTRLYSSASLVLRHIDRLDSTGVIKAASAPFYFVFATILSTVVILRLLKSSVSSFLDDNAKDTFFMGVNILKRLSIEHNDTASRMVLIMTQLWNSEKAFRRADGTECTSLRIRTRLAMSPVFDAIWWWREEYGNEQGVYAPPSDVRTGSVKPEATPSSTDVQAFPNAAAFPAAPFQEISSFLDDQLLAELGWTNSSNYLYPQIPASYANDWYSPTDLNGFAI
ncbi:Zn(II)2Cys6 transcription factor [Trichodelitschia bisporula]|uniref:Zn(II)2Cys6 transcription factor n=1 Tax=Trichodelitschia bisporula TaxID=703511 RepID=A0A6G1HKP2_9PEZI|nr:Zn(II)2Cys6 transcription factor [Trichodelitschia bisporula]